MVVTPVGLAGVPSHMTRSRSTPASSATTSALALTAVTALVMSAGCDDDFTPYSRLDKLRVLAIGATPVRPVPGEMATLTPLIYAPEGVAVTRTWSWCPFVGEARDGYPCLVDEAAVAGWGVAGAAPPRFDLGTGETLSFPHALSPEVLRRVCAGTADGMAVPVLPDCSAGFPVTVRLVVQTPSDRLEAVRTLHLRFEDAQEANDNPAIEQLVAGDGAMPLEGASIRADVDAKTPVGARVPEAAAERYTARDDRGQPVAAREQLTLTWFVEAGEPDIERTSFIDGVIPLARASENQWTFPDAPPGAPAMARMIVVVRDNRGGVGWRTATARLHREGSL
jgi:hypothetical protein